MPALSPVLSKALLAYFLTTCRYVAPFGEGTQEEWEEEKKDRCTDFSTVPFI